MYKTIEENKDLLKFNAEGVQPADMFLNARNKAVEAVDAFVKKHGEPMYCGFYFFSPFFMTQRPMMCLI